MAQRILVAEDNEDFARVLLLHLKKKGYEVVHARDGEEGLDLALGGGFALLILDIAMPKRDGLEILTRFRKTDSTTPVLMLTSKSEELDKVVGFELGADDYVTKPFSVAELLCRIAALLRRAGGGGSQGTERSVDVLSFGGLSVDLGSRKVVLDGKELELTAKEFDLLAFLASQPGQAFSREELLESVWKYDTDAYASTVNTIVMRVRKKIERDPAAPQYLETVRGYGYRFTERGE